MINDGVTQSLTGMLNVRLLLMFFVRQGSLIPPEAFQFISFSILLG